jgi:hypothetical protein
MCSQEFAKLTSLLASMRRDNRVMFPSLLVGHRVIVLQDVVLAFSMADKNYFESLLAFFPVHFKTFITLDSEKLFVRFQDNIERKQS